MAMQLNRLKSILPKTEQIVQKVIVEKKKKIDLQRLEKILGDKYNLLVYDILNRRKNNCLNRIQSLFNEGENSLRQLSFKVEETTYSTSTVRPV